MIKGQKLSEETKRKISESHKGKTPKNISMIAGWNKGKKCPWITELRKGKYHLTEEQKKKISLSKKGISVKHSGQFKKGQQPFNWKGGTHKEYQRFRDTVDFKNWRKSVFERDGYECQFCHSKGYVEPHHIRCAREYPELVFDLNNGITLCRSCHVPTINKEQNFIILCDWILKLKQNSEENNMINIISVAEAD